MTPGRMDTAFGKARNRGLAGRRVDASGFSADVPRSTGRPRIVAAATAWLCAALVGACSSSPPIRYHALSAVAAPVGGRASYDGPVLEVGSVQVPPAFGRPELVRDTAAGRFEIREFDLWAAPLPRLARQALAEDLEARLPAGKIVYPGASWPVAGAVLEVDVLSYRVGDGVAKMVASWSVRPRPAAGTVAVPGGSRGAQLRLETPVVEGSVETTTAAWNALLGQLADRVVAELAGSAAGSR